jgi:hypothetical protein
MLNYDVIYEALNQVLSETYVETIRYVRCKEWVRTRRSDRQN